MPIILISLAIGLVVAAGAAIGFWNNPSIERPSSRGTALLVVGIVFMAGGLAFIVTGQDYAYSWLPIGIVFLAVGARQRRQHKA